jgi:hypothetical protein
MRTVRAHFRPRLAERAAHRAQDRHGKNDAHEQSTDDAARRTAHLSSIAPSECRSAAWRKFQELVSARR